MTLKEAQQEVDFWIKKYGVGRNCRRPLGTSLHCKSDRS